MISSDLGLLSLQKVRFPSSCPFIPEQIDVLVFVVRSNNRSLWLPRSAISMRSLARNTMPLG